MAVVVTALHLLYCDVLHCSTGSALHCTALHVLHCCDRRPKTFIPHPTSLPPSKRMLLMFPHLTPAEMLALFELGPDAVYVGKAPGGATNKGRDGTHKVRDWLQARRWLVEDGSRIRTRAEAAAACGYNKSMPEPPAWARRLLGISDDKAKEKRCGPCAQPQDAARA